MIYGCNNFLLYSPAIRPNKHLLRRVLFASKISFLGHNIIAILTFILYFFMKINIVNILHLHSDLQESYLKKHYWSKTPFVVLLKVKFLVWSKDHTVFAILQQENFALVFRTVKSKPTNLRVWFSSANFAELGFQLVFSRP